MPNDRSVMGAGITRRDLFLLAGLAGVADSEAAATAPGVPAQPTAQALDLYARLVGDMSGKPALTYTAGTVWGFRPQADDLALADFARRIYGYKSLAVRKVRRLPGGDLAVRQQAWTFYADPVTDAITDTLRNPYTGADVKPYSPPSAPFETAYRPDGSVYLPGKDGVNPLGDGESTVFATPFDMRVRTVGAHCFVDTSQFIRFRTGNIDWYKLEATLVGYTCRTADLRDPTLTRIPSTSTMNIVAEWQTWMAMHGSPGHILFKGQGASIESTGDVPADVLAALAGRFPSQLDKALAW